MNNETQRCSLFTQHYKGVPRALSSVFNIKLRARTANVFAKFKVDSFAFTAIIIIQTERRTCFNWLRIWWWSTIYMYFVEFRVLSFVHCKGFDKIMGKKKRIAFQIDCRLPSSIVKHLWPGLPNGNILSKFLLLFLCRFTWCSTKYLKNSNLNGRFPSQIHTITWCFYI